MKVAVIGTGRMGGFHALLLGGVRGVSEVLVADVDPERADAAAESANGRAVSPAQAIDEADAIVIATPAETHAGYVRLAIERGVPVLCEKPLTDDLASSLELTRAAEDAGALVQMGFQRRHDPGYATARAAVADGRTGRIWHLRLTAFDPRVQELSVSDWPESETAPIFLHSSVHDFDFARWMTGQEVVEVTADGSRRDGSRPNDPRGIETATVTMHMSAGTLGVLEATWLHPTGYDNRVEIVAEHEALTVGLTAKSPLAHVDWPAAERDEPWTHYLGRFEAAYREEVTDFLAAVRGERPPASTARDGAEAMRIAVAATRAYAERRPVRLDEIPGIAGAEVV